MARIAGVDLPNDKRVEIGLTAIFGIGRTRSNEILQTAEVNPDTRVRDLTDEEITRIREAIEDHYTVEGDLRRETAMNIKRLAEIGCYRGRVIVRVFPCAAREPGLMRVRAKAPSAPWLRKRDKEDEPWQVKKVDVRQPAREGGTVRISSGEQPISIRPSTIRL
jgi:small subunit ribosomal protein S13